MQPENTYPLDYPSYGLTVFRDRAHEETEMVLFGNSKGELGMINIEKKTVHEMSAHQAAIRDILQIDEHHFLTASQDWLMKIWAVNTDSNNSNFALERQTVKGHSGKIHCLSRFGPNVLAAGADGLIRLWDIMGGIYD